MREIESHRCFGGTQLVVEHHSHTLGCDMRVAVFLPEGYAHAPVLYFLSGLTCSEQNAIQKSGAQRWCAEHGIVLVCPDTSPRGEGVADSPDYDLGQGAGFYLTATQAPWSAHFRMDAYVTTELVERIAAYTDSSARGITGHSMGGMGAIRLALANPGLYRSVSAFSPILQPLDVPWGHKAFAAYLGEDRDAWAAHDPASLVAGASERLPILVDQGDADSFLATQLHSERFLAACRAADHPVEYRLQPGYDHSYYFVSTFIGDHVAHHARYLR
ncbi:MAG: S-formylglutathione hydrolase [Alphaproteobacteria bacterium]|nr:S-formylglutathione hydrolase [Alphaproteobacteria bacterium]